MSSDDKNNFPSIPHLGTDTGRLPTAVSVEEPQYEILVMQYPLTFGQHFSAPYPSDDCELISSHVATLPVPRQSALAMPNQGMQVASVVIATFKRPHKDRPEQQAKGPSIQA
jgi:hypothetical protein